MNRKVPKYKCVVKEGEGEEEEEGGFGWKLKCHHNQKNDKEGIKKIKI